MVSDCPDGEHRVIVTPDGPDSESERCGICYTAVCLLCGRWESESGLCRDASHCANDDFSDAEDWGSWQQADISRYASDERALLARQGYVYVFGGVDHHTGRKRFDLIEQETGQVVKKSEVLAKIYGAAPWKIRLSMGHDPDPNRF